MEKCFGGRSNGLKGPYNPTLLVSPVTGRAKIKRSTCIFFNILIDTAWEFLREKSSNYINHIKEKLKLRFSETPFRKFLQISKGEDFCSSSLHLQFYITLKLYRLSNRFCQFLFQYYEKCKSVVKSVIARDTVLVD